MKTMALAAPAFRLPRDTHRLIRSEILSPPRSLGATRMMPVVTVAPSMRTCAPTGDPRAMILAKPRGEQAAAFRLLGEVLAAKGLPRVLAVTAPSAGEGATTCALNLALTLAETPKSKVLLVEGNFAAPALAAILGVDDVAESEIVSFSDPFTLSTLGALHVATLARRSPSLGHLDAMTLGNLLGWALRAGYDRVVIDAPSADKTFESDLIFRMAGGVLVAVRSGHSTRAALVRAAEHIGKKKALGVMLLECNA